MRQLKKIIIFYPNMERGGVINNLVNITNFLSLYYQINLITDANNIKKYKFDKNIKLIKVRGIETISHLFYKFFSTIKASYILFLHLRKLDTTDTIVFSFQSHVLSILVSKILNFKIIIRNSEDVMQSTKFSNNYLKAILIILLKYFFYNLTTKIITNSKQSFNSLKSIVCNKKKILLIYNPYLNRIYKVSQKNKRQNIILNIGRFCKQKNQFQLIDTFNKFTKMHAEYKLFLVGAGSEKKKLLEYIKYKKLEKKVFLKKWSDDLRKYYLKSKFFVLSSLYEGLPNVIIDSINFELPVVSTAVSGTQDILLGKKGGYIAKVNNEDSLFFAMQSCHNNYNIAKKKALYAKIFLHRFLIKIQNKKYLELVENI